MTATTLADAGTNVSRKLNAVADDAIDEVAGKARRAVNSIGARAHKAADQVSDDAQDLVETVQAFVDEQPLLALGVSALAGFLFAVLFVRRVPRTIYVKPNTH